METPLLNQVRLETMETNLTTMDATLLVILKLSITETILSLLRYELYNAEMVSEKERKNVMIETI